MKKLFLVLIFLLVSVGIASADFTWTAPDGDIIGYKITYNEYSLIIGNVTSIEESVFNFAPGVTYTMFIQAYNNYGQADQSNIIEYVFDEFIPTDNPKPVEGFINEPITNFVEE